MILPSSFGQSSTRLIAFLTLTPTISATATHISTPVPANWQTLTGIKYGKGIAFAVNDPQTGYICGNTNQQGVGTDPLQLGISHDGGTTWTKLILPAGNEASIWGLIGSVTWVGPTLFLTAMAPGNTGGNSTLLAHEVSISLNGGPLVWTAANPFPPATYQTSGYSSLAIPSGGMFGVLLNQSQLARTSDNGAHWDVQISSGNVPRVLIPSPDGTILYGDDFYGLVVRSTDGGLTWTPLAQVQGGDQATTIFANELQAAPDGTVYIPQAPFNNAANGAALGVYKLLPGNTAWPKIAEHPNGQTIHQMLSAVSWDTSGHPIALWAVATTNQQGGDWSPNIEKHGP